MIEFLSLWVFLLLPLPLLIRFWPPYRQYIPHIRAPMFDHLQQNSGSKPKAHAWVRSRSRLQAFLLIITWVSVLGALARPQWIAEPIAVEQLSRDLLVLVDISGSMDEPYAKALNDGEKAITRLDLLKQVLFDFADSRPGDRLGLLVFADRPYIQAPMTSDINVWRQLLLAAQVGPAGRNTAIGDAIGLGLRHLQDSQASDKVMLLLTDGSDNRSLVPPKEAALVAAQRDVRVFTVAIGEHVVAEKISGEKSTAINTNNTGNEVDIDTLQTVAKITNGAFYDARDNLRLAQLSDDFAAAVPSELQQEWYRPVTELYFYPLGVVYLVALFAVITSLYSQRKKETA